MQDKPADFDEPTIRADLTAVGFQDVMIDRIARTATAASARDAAVITVQGSLLRTAIETADPSRLGEATKAVEPVKGIIEDEPTRPLSCWHRAARLLRRQSAVSFPGATQVQDTYTHIAR